MKKANDLIEKSKLPEADKERFITSSILWRVYYLSANGELDKASNESEKGSLKVESRKNPGEEMLLNGVLGFWNLKKGIMIKVFSIFPMDGRKIHGSGIILPLPIRKRGTRQTHQNYSKRLRNGM